MTQSILGGISQEDTLREFTDTLIFLLSKLVQEQPRLDSADRLLVSLAEVNPTVNLAAAATLTTLSNLGASSRPADAIPVNMANSGAMHLYDNIRIT